MTSRIDYLTQQINTLRIQREALIAGNMSGMIGIMDSDIALLERLIKQEQERIS